MAVFNLTNKWILCLSDGATKASGHGIVTKLDPPRIVSEFDKTQKAGEIGIVPVFTGFKEMEMSFDVVSYDEDFYELIWSGATKWITARARIIGTDYLNVETKLELITTVKTQETPVIQKLSQGVESDTITLSVRAVILNEIGANDAVSELLKFEPANYVYAVKGVNKLESVKTFLTCP
jgi:phage tail tube protein FII